MSEPNKVKFGQRIIRGFLYGLGLGFLLYVVGSVASNTVSALPSNLGAIGFATGLACAVGIEVSKEMGK